MSNNPGGPFQSNPSSGGQAPHGSPYQAAFGKPQHGQPQFGQPPKPPGPSALRIVMIVLAVVGVLGLFTCGCCGGLLYMGMQVDSQQVASSVEDDPSFVSEIGFVKSCSLNMSATASAPEEEFVYDVVGAEGSGRIHMTDHPDGTHDAELRTANGKFPLTVDESAFSD